MEDCQTEVGISSAMTAAALGGSAEQYLLAAEIAIEHYLGVNCSSYVGGLTQTSCVERNTMGVINAINASQHALHGDLANARVYLDGIVMTKWDTTRDMNSNYRETIQAVLAINVPIHLSEC